MPLNGHDYTYNMYTCILFEKFINLLLVVIICIASIHQYILLFFGVMWCHSFSITCACMFLMLKLVFVSHFSDFYIEPKVVYDCVSCPIWFTCFIFSAFWFVYLIMFLFSFCWSQNHLFMLFSSSKVNYFAYWSLGC